MNDREQEIRLRLRKDGGYVTGATSVRADVIWLLAELEVIRARAVRAEAVVEAARDDPNQGVIAALAAYDAGQEGKPE